MNGLPLKMFNAGKYVKLYLAERSNSRCDDPMSPGSRVEKEEQKKDQEELEKDFKDKNMLSGKSTIFL